VEFTVVFPIILLICFGAVDFTLLTIKWVSLNKATYAGARLVAVQDPVAIGINSITEGGAAGDSCFDSYGNDSRKCTINAGATCTGDASGGRCCPVGSNPSSCAAIYAWNETTFQAVLDEMNKFMLTDSIDRRQLQITYRPTYYGFAHRPVGSPMNITVSVRCATYPFYLLYPLLGWAMPSRPSSCADVPGVGASLPEFPTTLPSEDLSTVN